MRASRSLHRLFGAAAACLASLACGPAQLAVVDIPPGAGGAASSSSADATAQEEGPGCAWRGESLEGRDSGVLLCFAAQGACFARATVSDGEVLLSLSEGQAARSGARLDVKVDGIRIEAWTAHDQPVLFPNRPIVFGGVAVPHTGRTVQIERVMSARAELALAPDDGVRPRQGPLRVKVPCDDLTLEPTDIAPEEAQRALGTQASSQGDRTVPAGQSVALAAVAGGPAILDATPEDGEDAAVELIETRGTQARIVWERAGLTLAGWVDVSVLRAATPPTSFSGLGSMWGGSGGSPGTRCNFAVPLFAEVAGTRQRAGTITAQTEFDPDEIAGAFTVVVLRTQHFDLEENAKWLVPTKDLQRCLAGSSLAQPVQP